MRNVAKTDGCKYAEWNSCRYQKSLYVKRDWQRKFVYIRWHLLCPLEWLSLLLHVSTACQKQYAQSPSEPQRMQFGYLWRKACRSNCRISTMMKWRDETTQYVPPTGRNGAHWTCVGACGKRFVYLFETCVVVQSSGQRQIKRDVIQNTPNCWTKVSVSPIITASAAAETDIAPYLLATSSVACELQGRTTCGPRPCIRSAASICVINQSHRQVGRGFSFGCLYPDSVKWTDIFWFRNTMAYKYTVYSRWHANP